VLGYSPTKTQELLGNPDKSDNPTASSPACAGLAGEHCMLICLSKREVSQNFAREVILIFKAGGTGDPGNCRPIALLSALLIQKNSQKKRKIVFKW